jgi:hypothetical protein
MTTPAATSPALVPPAAAAAAAPPVSWSPMAERTVWM